VSIVLTQAVLVVLVELICRETDNKYCADGQADHRGEHPKHDSGECDAAVSGFAALDPSARGQSHCHGGDTEAETDKNGEVASAMMPINRDARASPLPEPVGAGGKPGYCGGG
jgi:hypothetical protein